jgi:hypothetical protein
MSVTGKREVPLSYEWNRIVLAALMAPLVLIALVPLSMVGIDLARGIAFNRMGGDLSHSNPFAVLIFAYPLMFAIGVPAYLVALKFRIASIWNAMLVGALAANFPMLIVMLRHPVSVTREVARSPSSLSAVATLAFLGGVVGLAFWLLTGRSTSRKN